jgi:hypothetical protein
MEMLPMPPRPRHDLWFTRAHQLTEQAGGANVKSSESASRDEGLVH